VNAGLGLRWRGDRMTTSLKVTNLLNQNVQQHVFGDVLKRQVLLEVHSKF
jgi:hypothetical protein